MKTSKDFEELFGLLNRNNVRYVVIGGYAFSIHAEPRYTKDLDIFYDRNKDNPERILKTLREFGFGSLQLSIEDLQKKGRVIQLGNPPLRVDLLNDIEGVTFEQVWANKIVGNYGAEVINVISKPDLITNKKAVGRDQDLLDIKKLEEI